MNSKIQKLLVYLEKVVGKLNLIEYIVVDTLMMIGYSYFDLKIMIGMFQLVAIFSVKLNIINCYQFLILYSCFITR